MHAESDITLEHSTIVEKNIQQNINHYYNDQQSIEKRLQGLDEEWDVERMLALTASTLSLTGLVLARLRHKKWVILTGVVSGFLMNHAVSGWCPPVPLLRSLGYRNRAEIEKEKFALKALRGDFSDLIEVPNAVWNAVNK